MVKLVATTNRFSVSTERAAALKAVEASFEFGTQLRTDGISSFTLEVELALNAVVHEYDVVVRAKRASATPVEAVAQVRATQTSTPGSSKQGMSVVLDFGTPRTVSGVQVPAPLAITRIAPWIGMAFASTPVFDTLERAPAIGDPVILPSEVRTERLLVDVIGVATGEMLSKEMSVVLPESPTDLEVRIDGGAPAASFPGPAQPGPDSERTANDWNNEGERIVHLADAFSSLTGDPTRPGSATFKVVLSSRVPGELSIDPLPPKLSFIRRMMFGDGASKELVFAEEGPQEIKLDGLPTDAAIEEIRFTVAGTPPPERIIPPTGPDDADLADLVLSPDRAVCVRLRSDTKLSELTGLRLPLLAGGGGAEMRVVLWRNADSGLNPVEAMSDGVSEPLTLQAGTTETWTTFSFKRPVPFASNNPPWAALLVSRGEVTWGLGATNPSVSDGIEDNVILRGTPTGPWKPLPTAFQSKETGLKVARGRIRMIGRAPKDTPVAPLIIRLALHSQEEELMTPSAKGVTSKLTFAPAVPVSSPVLQVISRVPGSLTVRDVDVVSTK